MKSLAGGRPQYPYPPVHTRDPRYVPSYLLSPTEGSFPLDAASLQQQQQQYVSPRTSLHSDCLVMAPGLLPPSAALPADQVSSSTFPRMHYSSQYYNSIPREDCVALTPTVVHAPSSFSSHHHHHQQQQQQQQHHHHMNALSGHHGNPRSTRLASSGMLDQMEKQRPVQREGFHTLQYQRGAATGESPGRIRHLVHSVQKLFTKSHSLEGSSKANGGGGGRTDSVHHHHHSSTSSKHGSGKRSKSKERRHRSSGDWWSSDDNLDSDGTFRVAHGMMGARQQMEHASQHCHPLDHPSGHFGRLSLKTSKSSGDIKCSACKSAPPDGKFLKRSSWSTLTVSQAKEAYRKSSLNLDKPSSLHHDHHRLHHYLQVPGDEWRGYPGEEEIPCRRMRSSSYVKAMGDEESAGESDPSPKSSPTKAIRPDALVLKSAIQRPHPEPQSQGYHLQTSRDMRPLPSMSLDPPASYHPPPYRSRNQSYMRAVSTLSQASCVSQVSETEINGQFESVCESVFSELESQATGALDLPSSFRTRSHSYLRAIQAGYSQDDDCLPSVTSSTVTSTLRSTTEGYDGLDATSLLNDDIIEDDDAASSSAYQELENLEREHAARSQHSTSSTVTAISVPPSSPRGYRVPLPPRPPPTEPAAPQALQAFKESAGVLAAFNMQWKEEISAMRYELAELRRDVCGELKTFNSNFFNFTQCYNMWTMCREATDGSGSGSGGGRSGGGGGGGGGLGGPGERVSVGTQAGNGGAPVRQDTVDASVMCQPEPSVLCQPEPAAFSILDLIRPPLITIPPEPTVPELTVTSASPTSASPTSSRTSEDSTWDPPKKQRHQYHHRPERHDGRRSTSLELWSRKYPSGPMAYLSLSF